MTTQFCWGNYDLPVGSTGSGVLTDEDFAKMDYLCSQGKHTDRNEHEDVYRLRVRWSSYWSTTLLYTGFGTDTQVYKSYWWVMFIMTPWSLVKIQGMRDSKNWNAKVVC